MTTNLDELGDLIKGVTDGVTLPNGNLRDDSRVDALFGAIDRLAIAREFRDTDPAFAMVKAEASRANGDVKAVLDAALLRQDDHVFLDHGAPGLIVWRADFTGESLSFPGHDLSIVRAGDAIVPRTTKPGEEPRLTLLAEIQVFIACDPDSRGAIEASDRELDRFDLLPTLTDSYERRLARRVAWGSGALLVTDQRLVGILFSDEVEGRPQSQETLAMPISVVAPDVSSAVMFIANRGQFDRREVTAGRGLLGNFLYNRVPVVDMLGTEYHVNVNSTRVVDISGAVTRPAKGAVDAVLSDFCMNLPSVCRSCGAALSEGGDLCETCGRDPSRPAKPAGPIPSELERASSGSDDGVIGETPRDLAPEARRPSGRNARPWVIGGAVAVAVAAVVGTLLVVFGRSGDPTRVVQTIELASAAKSDAAYPLCFSPTPRAQIVIGGVTHRSNFLACGDKTGGTASGEFSAILTEQSSNQSATLTAFSAIVGIDEASTGSAGATSEWSVYYSGSPLCKVTGVTKGSPQTCAGSGLSIPIEDGVVALQFVMDVQSLDSTTSLWAAFLHPTVTVATTGRVAALPPE